MILYYQIKKRGFHILDEHKEIIRPKVVVVDSGICSSHPQLYGYKITGVSALHNFDSSPIAIEDTVGHGTAICGIILQHCPNAELFVIKLFDQNQNHVEDEALIRVLQYIEQNVPCDIINLSLGINMCNHKKQLYDLCRKLDQRGSILISAFDNWESLSYPAAFDVVIGVSSGEEIYTSSELDFIDNSVVNFLAYGKSQRVFWKEPYYQFSGGNSFACAHVSGLAASLFCKGDHREALISRLKKKSKHSYSVMSEFRPKDACPTIQKAVLFPFNKEMHSLVRFQHLLHFSITGVYDSRLSGRVGAKTSRLLHMSADEKDFFIKNIGQLDYESFDTLILGHIRQMAQIEGTRDIFQQIISRCLKENKQIYSFDRLPGVDNRLVYTPHLSIKNVPDAPFGKLYRCPLPVLGVFGTTSKQGKFTLQLYIREQLIKRGYAVGQIGSEPSSPLFGMDFCFHYGYDSQNEIIRYDCVKYINYCMNQLDLMGKEIILVGGQSKMVCYDNGNLSDFPFPQLEFLLATYPDAVVLCVNPFDMVEDIERTKRFIEAATESAVLALVVFPVDLRNPSAGIYSEKVSLTESNYRQLKKKLTEYFRLPVYRLGEADDMNHLTQICIDYFS